MVVHLPPQLTSNALYPKNYSDIIIHDPEPVLQKIKKSRGAPLLWAPNEEQMPFFSLLDRFVNMLVRGKYKNGKLFPFNCFWYSEIATTKNFFIDCTAKELLH